MQQYLNLLDGDDWVLDLGSKHGSFDADLTSGKVVRVDLSFEHKGTNRSVQADAAHLPFRTNSIKLVVANHSLEHFEHLDQAIREIGRVTHPTGCLFVSVPDASTLCDVLYRWLARGGGHVNRFVLHQELSDLIKANTGMSLQAMHVLYTSFSFLNRKNSDRLPLRTWLVGGGFEITLQVASYCFRRLDRLLGTRFSVYGWAYYFGDEPISAVSSCSNVCIRCGSGHDAEWLIQSGLVSRALFLRKYRCPRCTAWNLYTRDLRDSAGDLGS